MAIYLYELRKDMYATCMRDNGRVWDHTAFLVVAVKTIRELGQTLSWCDDFFRRTRYRNRGNKLALAFSTPRRKGRDTCTTPRGR